jgi:hypothetical protein
MKIKPVIECLIYVLVVVLCVAGVLLIWVLPPGVIDSHVVYKGF